MSTAKALIFIRESNGRTPAQRLLSKENIFSSLDFVCDHKSSVAGHHSAINAVADDLKNMHATIFHTLYVYTQGRAVGWSICVTRRPRVKGCVGIGFILRSLHTAESTAPYIYPPPDFVALWLVYYLMLTLLWPLLLQQQHQVIKRAHQIVLKSILNKVLDNHVTICMHIYMENVNNIQRRAAKMLRCENLIGVWGGAGRGLP